MISTFKPIFFIEISFIPPPPRSTVEPEVVEETTNSGIGVVTAIGSTVGGGGSYTAIRASLRSQKRLNPINPR